jgi:hypothetical protein
MSSIRRFAMLMLLSTLSVLGAVAGSSYLTYLNGFGSLSRHIPSNAAVQGNYLVDVNERDVPRVNVDTFTVTDKSFKYYVRIANLNNSEGKSYKVRSASGKKSSVSNPVWGLVWNYRDSADYCCVRLHCANSALNSVFDKRCMVVEAVKVEAGVSKVLDSATLTDCVDLFNGFNVICVAYDGKSTNISIGNKTLRIISELPDIDYNGVVGMGYLVGSGAKVSLERAVCTSSPIVSRLLATSWTKQLLDEHFAAASDPFEGYWTYLDRNLDENQLRLGGRYTLALVKSPVGYDIIYVDGAQVNVADWKCGMIKGKLTSTNFVDNYDLLWWDATMSDFSVDVYATIENGVILTLKFPTYKSQVRFARKMQ